MLMSVEVRLSKQQFSKHWWAGDGLSLLCYIDQQQRESDQTRSHQINGCTNPAEHPTSGPGLCDSEHIKERTPSSTRPPWPSAFQTRWDTCSVRGSNLPAAHTEGKTPKHAGITRINHQLWGPTSGGTGASRARDVAALLCVFQTETRPPGRVHCCFLAPTLHQLNTFFSSPNKSGWLRQCRQEENLPTHNGKPQQSDSLQVCFLTS